MNVLLACSRLSVVGDERKRARKKRGRTNVLSAMVLSLSVVPCGLSNKMRNSAREEFCSTEIYFYQSKQSHDSLQCTSQQEESSHN